MPSPRLTCVTPRTAKASTTSTSSYDARRLQVLEGDGYAVGYEGDGPLRLSPGYRNVLVLDAFADGVALVRDVGLEPEVCHLANSAATLTNPSARFDMVRPGVSIYGLSPVPDIGGPPHFGLREAMRVVARLINVKDCPPGQGISYGHQYTTKGDTRLGLVPLGYADGIPRHASGVGPMQVHGRRYTVAGRVCMDQMVLDLGADSQARSGDEALELGLGPAVRDYLRCIRLAAGDRGNAGPSQVSSLPSGGGPATARTLGPS